MKTVCGWCGKTISDDGNGTDELVSHGMCDACMALQAGNKQSVRDLLNTMDLPVLAVDSEGIIVVANRQAQKILGKGLEAIEGMPGGDAVECVYARLPQGCGNTEHCKACTIRRTVMETHQTGKEHFHVPAYQNINTPQGPKTKFFLISTIKVDQYVMLRIESMESATGS